MRRIPPVSLGLELPEQRFEGCLVALHESLEQFPVHGIGHRLPHLTARSRVRVRGGGGGGGGGGGAILPAGCGMLCWKRGGGCHMRQIAALTALLWIVVPATAAGQDAKTVIDNASKALGCDRPELNCDFRRGGVRQLRSEPDDLVRALFPVDQELHAHDRFHEASVARDGPGRASGRASRGTSSTSRTTVSIRSAHAVRRIVGRADGHLGDAMGLPAWRCGERSNQARERLRRHVSRRDLESARKRHRAAVSRLRLHQPAAVHRACRDVGRASVVR